MSSDTLFELSASAPRRLLALAVHFGLGLMLVLLALGGGLPALPALALVALGAVAVWRGEALRRATLLTIRLTPEGLSDSAGRQIAAWDDILRVERGAFAMRPSNGFLLVLARPGPGVWAPGLWWRAGRRVGVGGVTPGPATRALAERLALGPLRD